MSWVMVGVTAAGVGAGALKGRKEEKQRESMQKAEAEKTRYSPWTGVTGQTIAPGPGMLGGALQGGMTGAMMGAQFGKFGGGAKTATQNAKPIAMNYQSGNSQWGNMA